MPTDSADEQSLASRVSSHLELLYPLGEITALTAQVLDTMGLSLAADAPSSSPNKPHWSHSDVALITYADIITEPGEIPLQTLRKMISELFGDAVSIVHLLPFYPASSDGGFAVINHQAVAAGLGTWDDVEALASQLKLMVDLVCGHVSKKHRWVDELRAGGIGHSTGAECLMTATPDVDLSNVVRPRTHPLLQPIDTPTGQQHLWCTFSPDQIDIDYHQPEALLALLRTLKNLLDHGTKWVRLDAIAYLWKEPGTSCIHLPQTHAVVKLLRLLMNAHNSRNVLLTETNVSHEQNVSYFGNGEDESNVVYNFTLAPLLVHTFLSGSATQLQKWARGLALDGFSDTTYLNFIASHDGIGLRPVEDLLTDTEMKQLLSAAKNSGGTYSEYDTPAGKRPYEINVSLFDLFRSFNDGAPNSGRGNDFGVAQYLAAHTIMLSLAGVPAFYIHSLLCTSSARRNENLSHAANDDPPRTGKTRTSRSINRQKITTDQLTNQLAADQGLRRSVVTELLRLIRIRQSEPAFDPGATQRVLLASEQIFSLMRAGSLLCLTNVSNDQLELSPAELHAVLDDAFRGPRDSLDSPALYDLVAQNLVSTSEPLVLKPAQTVWLKQQPLRQ